MSGAVPFGDYIVYVDESGDHGLVTMDPHYPIFVLAFCLFDKRTFAESVVPAMLWAQGFFSRTLSLKSRRAPEFSGAQHRPGFPSPFLL